jgi:hypothetical protein
MTNNKTDILLCILIGISLIIILGILIVFLKDFLQELRYLNKEIQCNHGAERTRWIRERRRLWLSLLPFIQH